MTPHNDVRFHENLQQEVERARAKHPMVQSPHYAYAVILEEVDEFWDLVKAQSADPVAMRKELMQIAAVTQRAITELDVLQ